MEIFDAILIPGGGLTAAGELPPYVIARLNRALERSAHVYLPLSAATPHKPLGPHLESIAAAQYLHQKGIPENRILVETASYDTIGNAYFARLLHTDPRSLHKLLVITSEFHMARTEAIFRWIFGAAPEAGYELMFEATPNVGVSTEALAARRTKEERSLAIVRTLATLLTTLPQIHEWLYSEHEAYAWFLRDRAFRAAGSRDPILDTY